MIYEDVKLYISESIFHSDLFDKLAEDKKIKAVKNAEQILYITFKGYNPEDKPLPVEAIAYQSLWILEKDSGIRKAELGLASQSIEGMTQTYKGMDRTVSPEVKRILKKRVGGYALFVSDTHRGMYRR